jgi:hypothetical protein
MHLGIWISLQQGLPIVWIPTTMPTILALKRLHLKKHKNKQYQALNVIIREREAKRRASSLRLTGI